MTLPRLTATYRLQMNAGFTLANARERVGYFAELGVSHLYLSPIFAARRGSKHGYDVVDPSRINPELGTEAEFRALSADLHGRGMGVILDIVPNHMGIGPENRYWDDVLTHGESSRYAKWFDIDWSAHKVVLPVLGAELDQVIDRGELTVKLVEGHTPRVTYFAQSFPLDPDSLPPELQLAQADPEEAGTLAETYSSADGHDRLRELLGTQHYRLVSWRAGADQINYRRFFDVNDLAALRIEEPDVFAETHAYLLGLVADGLVDGLRVDHIDGLRRPQEYLERLRAAVPKGMPIFLEKILALGEQLPASWPVDGTTGYEFLNDVTDLFIDPRGFAELEATYRRARRLGSDATFAELARLSKMKMLGGPLRADVNRLVRLLEPVARDSNHRWPRDELASTLIQLLAALPVYRTYIEENAPLSAADGAAVDEASATAIAHGALPDIVAFIKSVITKAHEPRTASDRAVFIERFQQLSGPATAKGVEDTALYGYVPLAARNEVGGAPDRPLDGALSRLHEANETREARWPSSLLATTTHDTKRSADVRSRLAALSEVPVEWGRCLRRWRKLNARYRTMVAGRMAPDLNGEWLIYQTLVALWPPPRAGRRIDDLPDRAWRDSARERLTRYMLKAMREAKMRTSWIEPDPQYERTVEQFIQHILQPAEDAPFLADVARFVSRIAPIGAYDTLARIAIQLTSPGTPDIYQGDELWNYTLVDPDNRRQVDYDLRRSTLDDLAATATGWKREGRGDLYANQTKLLVLHRLLALRRCHAELFRSGSYLPLAARGQRAQHVIAYARSLGPLHVIVIVPRLVGPLLHADVPDWWADTCVELPVDARLDRWSSYVLDETVDATDGSLLVGSVLAKLPVMVAVN